MRTATLLLTLALTSSCASPMTPRPTPAGRAEGPSTAAIAPVLRPGELHRYALQWRTHGARRRGAAEIDGGLELRGELVVTALGREQGGTRVALWFTALEQAEIAVQGQAVPLDPALLLHQRAEIVVADDGDVRRARFADDAAPVLRELMTGVIARLDMRGATGPELARQVRGGLGLAQVHYTPVADGTIARSLDTLVRFDIAPDLAVGREALQSQGTLELDPERVPVRIELHDAVGLDDDGLAADDRFTLTRTAVERTAVPAPIEGGVEIDPTAAADAAAVQQALDRQFAAETTMADVQQVLVTIDGGVLPRQGETSRALAYLRGWPEQLPVLAPQIHAAGDGGRQLGFDMLAGVGTPQAQALMVALLRDEAIATSPSYPLLLQRFAFVDAPTRDSAEFLLERLARADATATERAAVLHPLGSVARRLTDAALSERMHGALVAASAERDADIRAAAISGLGNARRRDDLARLQRAATDEDPGVRTEAVAALRTHVVPGASATLLAALADPDRGVADRALTVLHQRHLDGATSPALLQAARDGGYNPALDRAMAEVLLQHRDDADAREALLAIAARTDDPDLAHTLTSL
ncbi:MAG: HEAT repeat domain-containing protein [Nannocystaceae bacterium]